MVTQCCLCVLLVAFIAHVSRSFFDQILPCIREDPELKPASLLPPAPNLTRVHVVYGGDAKYFGGLLVSMLSLSAHLQEPGNCTVHVIVPPKDLEQAERLLECFRREVRMRPRAAGQGAGWPEVVLHKMQPLDVDITDFSTSDGTTHQLVYTKFVLHKTYLPNASRALWLDTDTIVMADVAPLFRMPMAHPLAAALDYSWMSFENRKAGMNASTHHLVKRWSARTITTGVMVYDLDRWRAGSFERRLAALAEELSGYDGEQLPMNLLFQGDADVLDGRWNVVQGLHDKAYAGTFTSRPCIGRAWILHSTGGRRKYWHADSDTLFDDLLEPHMPVTQCEAWQQSWRKTLADPQEITQR